MRITMPAEMFKQIEQYGRQALPFEACGVMYGQVDGQAVEVSDWKAIANVADRPDSHFNLSPDQWIEVLYAQSERRRIVGLFHSHPRKAPLPSPADYATLWSWPTYWIISYAESPDAVWNVYDGEWRLLPSAAVRFTG